jgi:hypothetical protein
MKNNALDNFIISIKDSWTGLNSETVIKGRKLLEQLAKTPISESWLADLHHKKQESVELYRDQNQGFVLLAHVELQGNYRVPHNHGAGWVFYAVQHGAMEMSTYSQVADLTGKSLLVSRGANDLKAGECNVYLPDDIHDTKCLSDYVLMFRLTSCDFKGEKREGRLVQYTN